MIPFNDLKPLHTLLASEIDAAMQRVFQRGWFILGPEVEAFEAEFAAYHGVQHAVGVGNGTDAIELALRATGIGLGDEVITVAHTAIATVNAVERAGAAPILVDIDPQTYTMDVNAAAAAITPRTKALLPVHLYGQPADLTALKTLAEKHHLLLIEDCAQAHGARWNGQLVGTFGDLATFSFYPTKNLGAYGDGGAVITRDSAYADKLKRLRNYGQTTRYTHVEWGTNSRLDDVQAGILRVKLAHLDEHNAMRNTLAQAYHTALNNLTEVTLPYVHPDANSVFHLYVVRHARRDDLMDALKTAGIGTLIHYPIPIHLQDPYRHLNLPVGSLPQTEQAAREILSLPMYIGLTQDHIMTISSAVAGYAEQLRA